MRRISMIYFSESGNTEQVAQWIRDGVLEVPNTEIRLFNLKDTEDPDQEYVEACDAVIFGTPDRKSTRLNSSHRLESRMPSPA